jgi:TRAP transporter TAXI family solute receptor
LKSGLIGARREREELASDRLKGGGSLWLHNRVACWRHYCEADIIEKEPSDSTKQGRGQESKEEDKDMRHNQWKVICATLVLGALILCCGTYASAEEKISIPPMNFSTAGVGGGWFPIGSAISDNLNKMFFKGYPITGVPGAGGVGNPKRVSIGEGQVKFGFSYAPFLMSAVAGKPPYDKAYPNLKAVCGLITNAFHFIGAKDLNIMTVSDIKKRKIPLRLGTGPSGSTELFAMQAIFEAMGLSLDDLVKWGGKIEKVLTSGRTDLWKDRHIDAWEGFINPPSSAVTQVLMARPGNLIGLEKPLRDALIKKWGFVDYILPAGIYKGQDKPLETLGLTMVLFARDDVPDNIAYLMAKGVSQMKDKLIKVNAGFTNWKPEGMCNGLGIETHPGAMKFYKEKGWL